VQLVGRPLGEDALFRAGAVLEGAFSRRDVRPTLPSVVR
jgi:hypothetical protein